MDCGSGGGITVLCSGEELCKEISIGLASRGSRDKELVLAESQYADPWDGRTNRGTRGHS